MSRAEALKEKLAKYRDILKAIVWGIMAILTGIVSVAYNILTHKIEAYMAIFGAVGLIIVFLVALHGLSIWDTIEKLEKELEDA